MLDYTDEEDTCAEIPDVVCELAADVNLEAG